MTAPTRLLHRDGWRRLTVVVVMAAVGSWLARPSRLLGGRPPGRRASSGAPGQRARITPSRVSVRQLAGRSVGEAVPPSGAAAAPTTTAQAVRLQGAPAVALPGATAVALPRVPAAMPGLPPVPADSPAGPGSPVAPPAPTPVADAHQVPVAADRLRPDGAFSADDGPRTIPDHGTRHLPLALWLAVYVLALVVPLAIVVIRDQQEPRTFILELGSALGIAALSLLAVQLALPARLPVLAAIGAEVAVRLHRRMADILLAVVAAHVAAVMVADPRRLQLLEFFGEPWRAQAAIGSVVALVVLMLTSFVRRRLRLSYVAWRAIHILMGGLALVLAVAHTVGVGRYLVQGPAGVALAALTAGGLGALLLMRMRWFRRSSLRPYVVDEVIAERGGAITIALRADGHEGQRFIPGQFAWLKLEGARTALAEHPFSYSSSAESPAHPQFTMQPRAGFSARAAEFEAGTRLLVDGPHGAFRPRTSSDGTALVAGGIGITPSMSILRTAADHLDPRPFVLVYAARTLDSMTFLDEIEAMRGRIDLTFVPVLSSPPPDWTGERGRIDAKVLDHSLPRDLRRWQFLVCGSGSFVDAVVGALETVGIPGERVHAERFVEV